MQRAGQLFYSGRLKEEHAAFMAAREERLLEIREQADVRAEERKQAPYLRASQRGDEAVRGATRFDEDAAGNVTRNDPAAAEQARLRAGAYDAEGLPDVGSRLRSEALNAERLDLERAKGERADRRDTEQHTERMAGLQKQLNVQERMLQRQFKLDKRESNTFIRTMDYLVQTGIAKDPADAFAKWNTGKSKSPESTLQQMVLALLRSGDRRYLGNDGKKNAIQDARDLTEKVRSVEDGEFGAGFDRAAPIGAQRQKDAGRRLEPANRRPMNAFLLDEEG